MLSAVNLRPVAALVVVAGAVVVIGVVAWRLLDDPPTYDPDTALSEQCDDVPAGAERVTLSRDDGITLGAALVGPADHSIGLVENHDEVRDFVVDAIDSC